MDKGAALWFSDQSAVSIGGVGSAGCAFGRCRALGCEACRADNGRFFGQGLLDFHARVFRSQCLDHGCRRAVEEEAVLLCKIGREKACQCSCVSHAQQRRDHHLFHVDLKSQSNGSKKLPSVGKSQVNTKLTGESGIAKWEWRGLDGMQGPGKKCIEQNSGARRMNEAENLCRNRSGMA